MIPPNKRSHRPQMLIVNQGSKLSRQEKHEYWQAGFERTILAMFLLGIIVVA